jgi:hypothetical protein
MQPYQGYQNNFNQNFNPKYRNMAPMPNGPGYHQRMMMPPQQQQQQYMNNQMQPIPPNMMINRQQMQYQQGPNYHMTQNFNNGSMVVPGGPMPPYNMPPGHIPPPSVNFMNNNQQMMNNKPMMPPYNGIMPPQPGMIPPQIMSNSSMIGSSPNFLTEAQFYSLQKKERLKERE